jgi:hypothetical protein
MDIFSFGVWTFLFGLAAEGATSFFFIRGLRKFPLIYEYFGEPTLMSENSMGYGFPTYLRLLKRSYADLEDPSGVAFCDVFRLPMLCTVVLFWIALATLLICLVVYYRALPAS